MSKIFCTVNFYHDGPHTHIPQFVITCCPNTFLAVEGTKLKGWKFGNPNWYPGLGFRHRVEYGVMGCKAFTKFCLILNTSWVLPPVEWASPHPSGAPTRFGERATPGKPEKPDRLEDQIYERIKEKWMGKVDLPGFRLRDKESVKEEFFFREKKEEEEDDEADEADDGGDDKFEDRHKDAKQLKKEKEENEKRKKEKKEKKGKGKDKDEDEDEEKKKKERKEKRRRERRERREMEEREEIERMERKDGEDREREEWERARERRRRERRNVRFEDESGDSSYIPDGGMMY